MKKDTAGKHNDKNNDFSVSSYPGDLTIICDNVNLYKFLQINYATVCTGNEDVCTTALTATCVCDTNGHITEWTLQNVANENVPTELALLSSLSIN